MTSELGAADLEALARAAQAVDGSPPVNDQALVEARTGEARLLGDEHAAAVLRPGEVELVVHPDHRRQGLGAALARRVVDETTGPLAFWAHGDHPGARGPGRAAGPRRDAPAAPATRAGRATHAAPP